MPQVRDPKTGRFVSGGSSMGGAAGTNPRVSKAKAVGGGAPAGGNSWLDDVDDDTAPWVGASSTKPASTPDPKKTKMSPKELTQELRGNPSLNSDPRITMNIREAGNYYDPGVVVSFDGRLLGGNEITLWESGVLKTKGDLDGLSDMYRKGSQTLDEYERANYRGLRPENPWD